MRDKINGLQEEQRAAIRGLANSGRWLEAIKEAKRILGLSIGDATFLVENLKK